jgi:type II secretory pathway pseudopilin PulG
MTVSTQRRWTGFVVALLVTGFLASLVIGDIVTRRQQSETNRADTAVAALADACAQVERLGGHCAVDPSSLKGDRGDSGPAGPTGPPGPSGLNGASIVGPSGPAGAAGAVGPAGAQGPAGAEGQTGPQGPTGPAGQDGAPGPACPTGYHQQALTVITSDGPHDIVACVLDPTPSPTPTPAARRT